MNTYLKNFLIVFILAVLLTVLFEYRIVMNLPELLINFNNSNSPHKSVVNDPLFALAMTLFFSLIFTYHIKYAFDNFEPKIGFQLLLIPALSLFFAYNWRMVLTFHNCFG